MPSTTPNFGFPYPISSDDLNAGATTVGSMATAIDSKCLNLDTQIASMDARKASIRLHGYTTEITQAYVGRFNVTTDAYGFFSIGGVSPTSCIVVSDSNFVMPYFSAPSTSYWIAFHITEADAPNYYLHRRINTTIPVTIFRWV